MKYLEIKGHDVTNSNGSEKKHAQKCREGVIKQIWQNANIW